MRKTNTLSRLSELQMVNSIYFQFIFNFLSAFSFLFILETRDRI